MVGIPCSVSVSVYVCVGVEGLRSSWAPKQFDSYSRKVFFDSISDFIAKKHSDQESIVEEYFKLTATVTSSPKANVRIL